jgi:hypothetical protein
LADLLIRPKNDIIQTKTPTGEAEAF